MLKPYPSVEEFSVNDYQRGYMHAVGFAIDLIARKYSGKAQYFENETVETFKENCLSPLYDAIHRYEPGHDKPANSL
jgi:hypothetical protein